MREKEKGRFFFEMREEGESREEKERWGFLRDSGES